eukprot:m.49643 g.49643  ORF g.49643 m.49643 type:complete len:403 (-) comp11508_c0_seq1:25-1233(-)
MSMDSYPRFLKSDLYKDALAGKTKKKNKKSAPPKSKHTTHASPQPAAAAASATATQAHAHTPATRSTTTYKPVLGRLFGKKKATETATAPLPSGPEASEESDEEHEQGETRRSTFSRLIWPKKTSLPTSSPTPRTVVPLPTHTSVPVLVLPSASPSSTVPSLTSTPQPLSASLVASSSPFALIPASDSVSGSVSGSVSVSSHLSSAILSQSAPSAFVPPSRHHNSTLVSELSSSLAGPDANTTLVAATKPLTLLLPDMSSHEVAVPVSASLPELLDLLTRQCGLPPSHTLFHGFHKPVLDSLPTDPASTLTLAPTPTITLTIRDETLLLRPGPGQSLKDCCRPLYASRALSLAHSPPSVLDPATGKLLVLDLGRPALAYAGLSLVASVQLELVEPTLDASLV